MQYHLFSVYTVLFNTLILAKTRECVNCAHVFFRAAYTREKGCGAIDASLQPLAAVAETMPCVLLSHRDPDLLLSRDPDGVFAEHI